MANFKHRRPRRQRACCGVCKPWKKFGEKSGDVQVTELIAELDFDEGVQEDWLADQFFYDEMHHGVAVRAEYA